MKKSSAALKTGRSSPRGRENRTKNSGNPVPKNKPKNNIYSNIKWIFVSIWIFSALWHGLLFFFFYFFGALLLSGWLVDEQDKAAVDAPELAGITVRAMPLYMTDLAATTAIARAALELAAELTG